MTTSDQNSNKVSLRKLAAFPDLFDEFSAEEMQTISTLIKHVTLTSGQYLFYEGTSGEEIYMILAGKLGVQKSGQKLARMHAGEYLGEISVLDGKPRSASIYARCLTKLYVLNVHTLQQHFPALYHKLIINLSKVLPERVRSSSEFAVASLQREVSALKQQTEMGRLLSYVMVILAVYVVGFRLLAAQQGALNLATHIRLTLGLAVVVFLVAWKNSYSLEVLGLTWRGSKQAIIESLSVSFFFMMILILVKWALIKNVPSFQNEALFKIISNHGADFVYTVIGYLIYSPIQEFIARGCLQSAFEQFLVGKHSKLMAIVLANLLFSSFYANISVAVSFSVFMMGFLWGWLYSRHHTLVGVILSHALLSIWIISIVGLPIQLI